MIREFGHAISRLYENHDWVSPWPDFLTAPLFPACELPLVISQLEDDFNVCKAAEPALADVTLWHLRDDGHPVLIAPGVWEYHFAWYVVLPQEQGPAQSTSDQPTSTD